MRISPRLIRLGDRRGAISILTFRVMRLLILPEHRQPQFATMAKQTKRPRDSAAVAKRVVEIASHELPSDSSAFASESVLQWDDARATPRAHVHRNAVAKQAGQRKKK
jgi:hypothetical protein